jgi:uncharacterized membrane protein YccC
MLPPTPRALLALPGFVVNGLSVAVGIGVMQLLLAAVLGTGGAQLAIGGAICASLSDLPNTVARTWRRVALAILLAAFASAVVSALRADPVALGVGIGVVGFIALMTMAWGTRAATVSFAPILALVFTMAVPAATAAAMPVWKLPLLTAIGGGTYLAWSMLAGALLQPVYRRSALRGAVIAAAGLLRSRARVLDPATDESAQAGSLRGWIRGETLLGERLQAARDLIFGGPDVPAVQRDSALLLRVIDLRDGLVASRLDLDLLGRDDAGRWVLARVSEGLAEIARRLDAVVEELRSGEPPAMTQAPGTPLPQAALLASAPMTAGDPRRRVLPAVAARLQRLADDTQRMHALLHGIEPALPLTHAELQHFVAAEGWPLRALKPQLRTAAPVLRHAVRTGIALSLAYFIGLHLPWASHPHWLVLSVAVVLRGNLEQTLTRRNARVGGTVLGCLVVLGLALVKSPPLLALAFLVAIGTAHSFVLRRYWLAAAAATVMALLQAHLVSPAGGFAVGERIADTFLGAGLAWAFSYVLPSWERAHLPAAVRRLTGALRDYAGHALAGPLGDAVPQRLARRRAYDALTDVAASLERSRAEPRDVQLPMREVARLVDHAQRLLAHLSVVRLMLAGQRIAPQDAYAATALQATGEAVKACLDLDATDITGPIERGARELASLPPEAPAHDIRPWLLRRLKVLVQEAHDIRLAAMAVTSSVHASGQTGAGSASNSGRANR